ncbi:MAG: beta-propeller fold lactonase family protein [Pseudomonadota bacterium]
MGNAIYNSAISAYSINAGTGALTAVAGSPFATGSQPTSIAVDPTGKFVYVGGDWSGVSAYSINVGTGTLTSISTLNAGAGIIAITPVP